MKFLSRGQKVQCALCRAFLSWPQVYFLDEPTVALDVDAYDHFCSLVRYARSQGATILISSHQLSAIEELCDGVAMLHNKNVVILKSGVESGLPKQWLIRCGADEKFGKAIESVCGLPAVYHDAAWHLSLAQPEEMVPRIVSALVDAGCGILEVRPESDSIKERIRTHYREEKRQEAV